MRSQLDQRHNFIRFFVGISALATVACGSRTGLNTPQEGPPTGVTIAGSIQCGYCLSRPFCYGGALSSHGEDALVDCVEGEPGCSAATCTRWIGTPTQVIGLDGAHRSLYCVRLGGNSLHTLPASQQEMVPPTNGSGDASHISACTLSDQEYMAWTGISRMPWTPGGYTREQWCHVAAANIDATNHYACNQIADDSSNPMATFSLLAPAQCGKRARMGANVRVCATPGEAGRVAGRRLLATYAAAFSTWETYNSAIDISPRTFGGLSPLRTIPFMCVVRDDTPSNVDSDCTPVAAPAPNLPVPFDPGLAPEGQLYQAAAGSQLAVTWNGQSTTVPVTGIASAQISEGPEGFRLTELRLTQSAPAQIGSGVTVTNGRADLENLWIGAATAGAITVQQPTSWLQASAVVGGAAQHMRLYAQSPPTGTWTGSTLHLAATYRDDANGVTYALTLHLAESQPRPTVAITSVSAVEPECYRYTDGFVGAPVTVGGSVSTSWGVWGLAASDTFASWRRAYPNASDPSLPLTTFDLPLRGPDDPPSGLMLSTTAGPFTALARRNDIRAVDRTPPTVVQTMLNVPCRWLAPERTKCLTVPGQFADNCSSTTSEILGAWAYDSQWNLIYTAPDTKCFVAPPSAVATNVNAYLLEYRVRDGWRNVSAPRWVLFSVSSSPSTDFQCPATLTPVIWWDWS